jgi:hypothetical protein
MSTTGRSAVAVAGVIDEVHGRGAVPPAERPVTPSESAEEVSMDLDEQPDTPVLLQTFAENDYCYGVGPLSLQIDRIDWSRPVRYDGETWYYVHGVHIGREGVKLGRRHVLVRGSRLPRPAEA